MGLSLLHYSYLSIGSLHLHPTLMRRKDHKRVRWRFAVKDCISKKNTLRSVSPRSPCAPDVPGAYNVNSCSGYVRPGSFRPEVKGPHPMRPDAQVTVRTHWTRAFLRPEAFDPPWRSHPPDTLPPAPSLFIPLLPMHPFPCYPFADVLRPRHLSSRPPPRYPRPPAFFP